MELILENWDKKSYIEFRSYLLTKQDGKYKEFHTGLVPGVSDIIGIRMPIQRNIAKEIAKGNWKSFLSVCEDEYYEIRMIQGLILGYIKVEYEEFIELFSKYIDKVDNWGICDSFCSGLKRVKKYDGFFDELIKYSTSSNPWHVRICFVTMLFHYIDDAHINKILEICDAISHNDYYVKMAKAWLISICYIKQPTITLKYLTEDNQLDDWTFNKSIQKTRESNRISPETKSFLKTLRRT